jgi:hypothetical protein
MPTRQSFVERHPNCLAGVRLMLRADRTEGMVSFIEAEDGAVTADWVVLTAAMVGLGLAVMSTISFGLETRTASITGTMDAMAIVDAFDAVLAEDDFETGRGAWLGGELRSISGFGQILALSSDGDEASLPIDVDPSHDYAVIEFDMIVGDSWDDENARLSIGGTEFAAIRHDWQAAEPTIQTLDVPGERSVTLTRVDTQSGTWNSADGRPNTDYVYRVRYVAANDGSDLTLRAVTDLDTAAGDEFLGIDNVRVTGTDRP